MAQEMKMTGSDRWLQLARVIGVVFSLLVLGIWIAGIVVLLGEPLSDCIGVACDPGGFYVGDLEVAESLGFSTAFFTHPVYKIIENVPIGGMYFAIAALIFWKKSDDWIALWVSMTLVILGGLIFTSTDDALVRAFPNMGSLRDVLTATGLLPVFLLFLYFPDGRIVPYRLRWVGFLIFAGFIYVTIFQTSQDQFEYVSNTLWLSFSIPFLIAAQIYRYFRVSGPTEKQQTKWIVVGLSGGLALMFSWSILGVFYPPDQPSLERFYALLVVVPLIIIFAILLPLTFAFSILRYRLWDIDILIRRTLSYAILTGLLAGVYFGAVVLMQNITQGLAGQADTPLITVISTLAIAALFNPLRVRIQDFIDRRFYRARYDAELALEGFSNLARDEVDMDRLAGALMGVVGETMQPEGASLWIRGGNGNR